MLIVPGREEDEFVDAKDVMDKGEEELEVIGTINAIEGREEFSTLRLEGSIKKTKGCDPGGHRELS